MPAPASSSDDGTLTTKAGQRITNFGERADRRAAVRALDQLQRDFRAGRMTAACVRISDFLLTQFTPRGTSAETPCGRKLAAYAATRKAAGDPTPRMKLLWVRSYTGQAGVWVDDQHDRPLRIQLSSSSGGGGWQLDLGTSNRPDVLAAELAGAAAYLRPNGP